jgi:NAD(P)-dependent dehydrogenase (short-subunit alcohol dehydrogenase family)
MEFGLQNRIAIITGMNNPQGIGAATALAIVNEGVRLALIYKKVPHKYAESKTDSDKGLASGGLTFKRESSCGLSRPNANPPTVRRQCACIEEDKKLDIKKTN